ncbi:hypothetical protein I6F35_38210 [Bradyrhizobium sp. BRP22]|nr:hypothetical protein [Bradyrhizobium sp. BRP22]MCA1458897.1 hypothetical protein [Bradyrhizobium sp. BRP22]
MDAGRRQLPSGVMSLIGSHVDAIDALIPFLLPGNLRKTTHDLRELTEV